MSKVILYCAEPSGLTLGPGPTPGECIQFRGGFARFDSDEFPAWESWVNHPGTPPIEILPPDSDLVASGTPDSFDCPICGKSFGKKIALTGHLRSHAPKE